MTDLIIAENVTKTYRVGVGRARGREMMPPPFDRPVASLFPNWWARNTFNALEDVSFSLPSGASLGLLGHNGAGKTTMLKVLAGVTAPNQGKITINGRIAALIDVLVGFHLDLTGRENIYLLGAVYGFNRKAMDSRVDRILDFAGIEDMADTPLKRYSSGMMARLGFSIIASLDVDILLVDEILAVGDAAFQRKCIEWLGEFTSNGGTLVFISHNLGLVRSMTQQVVWLDHGRVVEQGDTDAVLARYARAMEERTHEPLATSRSKASSIMNERGLHRWGAGGARIGSVHIDDPAEEAPLCVSIAYETADLAEGVFCVGFIDESGLELGAATSATHRLDSVAGTMRCVIDPFPFRSGIYFPIVAILSPDGKVQDRWRLDRAVVIEGNGHATLGEDFGPVTVAAQWSRALFEQQGA
jgi:ABC-type polysaccharide/polyol phosphate transport system ATPase subunit